MNNIFGVSRSNRMARALRLTPVALAMLTMSLAVEAQTTAAPASADEGSGLQSITVTARKVTEKLQDVPVAVTTFNAESLKATGIVQVSDVAAAAPNFNIMPAQSTPLALTLSLRGQYQNDALITLEPSVGIYVDDMYWARAYGLNSNFLDVQSVQVLNGPQGTLFGRNTTGGAMLITSNDPNPNKFGGSVELKLGAFNQRGGTAVLNVPVKEDVAAIRVAVTTDKRDGYATDIVSGYKYGNRDNTQARIKLGIFPTLDLAVVLSAEFADQKSDGGAMATVLSGGLLRSGVGGTTGAAGSPGVGGLPAGVAGLDTYVSNVLASRETIGLNNWFDGTKPYANAKTQTYSAKATLETAVGQVKLVAGTRHVTQDYTRDLDGSPYNVLIVQGATDTRQNSVELQLAGSGLQKKIDYAVGATYFTETGIDGTYAQTFGSTTSRSHTQGEIDNKSLGIYGQTSYHATKELSFTAGVRHSKDDKGVTLGNGTVNPSLAYISCSPISGATVANNCAAQRSDSFSNTSYTLGTDYKLATDQLIYAKYSTGYRAGAQNLRAAATAQFVPANPETVKEFEVGYKADFLDRKLRFNIAAFSSELTDTQKSIIVLLPGSTTLTQTLLANAAKVKNNGVEIEAKALLTPELTASLSMSAQDPKYASYTFQGTDHTGDRFQGMSKSQATFGLDYKTATPIGGLRLNMVYLWRSSYALGDTQGTPYSTTNLAGYNLSNVTPEQYLAATTAPASGIVNARVTLSLNSGFEVALWGNNLTNNRAQITSLTVASLFSSGNFREPRTFGLSGSYKF